MDNYFEEEKTVDAENKSKAETIKAVVAEKAYIIDIIKAIVNDNYTNEEKQEETVEEEKTLLTADAQEDKPDAVMSTLLDENQPAEEMQEEMPKPVDYFAEAEEQPDEKSEKEIITFKPPVMPSCRVDLDFNWFSSKNFDSEYEAKHYFEQKIERYHNRREASTRRSVSHIMELVGGYIENNGSEDNYYQRKLNYVSRFLKEYLEALNQAGVTLSEDSIKVFTAEPKPEKDTYKNIKEKLASDAVEYDKYHSVDWYKSQHFEGNTFTDFKEGIFGGHDVERYVIYGTEVSNAVNEMEQEIADNLKANLTDVWPEIMNVVTAFNRELAKEVMARLNSINDDVERACKLAL